MGEGIDGAFEGADEAEVLFLEGAVGVAEFGHGGVRELGVELFEWGPNQLERVFARWDDEVKGGGGVGKSGEKEFGGVEDGAIEIEEGGGDHCGHRTIGGHLVGGPDGRSPLAASTLTPRRSTTAEPPSPKGEGVESVHLMKALRFFEPGKVAVVEVAEPVAGPGEVILKLHATGLCNSDVRVYLGEKKAAAGVVTGHEMSGEVASVGAGANATVGETVGVCPIICCGSCSFCRDGFRNRCPSRLTLGYDVDGGIAEYVRIPASLVAMGQLLSMDPATPAYLRALLEPFSCVLNSIESLHVHAGAPMAIVGGGPMGLLHLIAAQAYGAGPILVVEPEADRRVIALELGADAAVAPDQAQEVGREMTKGEGFPAVAVAVGFSDAVPLALDLARRLGWVNLFAGFPPASSHSLDLNRVHYDEVRIFGTQNAPFHLYSLAASLIPRLPLLERVVTNRYALADAADAYTARLGKQGLKSAVVM